MESKILDTMMNKSPQEIFKVWHFLYKKEYKINSPEGEQFFQKFKLKLKEVQEHNSDLSKTWQKGLNQFSDITTEEFSEIYLTPLSSPPIEATTFSSNGYYTTKDYYTNTDGPATWKALNYTNNCGPVWNQAACGCCYAFSMVNTIECNYNIKTGTSVQLSRQQILDCNTLTGGCGGGDPELVSFYAKSQGMMMNAAYPYQAKAGTCQYNATTAGEYLDGIEKTGSSPSTLTTNPFATSNTVYDMLTRGALSISLDAGPLESYKTGVLNLSTGCSKVTHAVMIVGYAVDTATKLPYWLVKNSWGSGWGMSGYVKVQVIDNAQGNCFIYNSPFRPFKN